MTAHELAITPEFEAGHAGSNELLAQPTAASSELTPGQEFIASRCSVCRQLREQLAAAVARIQELESEAGK